MQNQGGVIDAPGVATAGGSIVVKVGGTFSEVTIGTGGGSTKTYPVGPDRTVTIPIPATATSAVYLFVGKGLRRQTMFIEIISPSP